MTDLGERFIDRTGWPAGPWDDEPDKLEWRFDDLPGYVGLIMRNEVGALCGYVGLPPEHPGHGVQWSNNAILSGLDVHGGITYAGPYSADGRIVWLVGFDCAHAGDDMPGMRALLSRSMLPERYALLFTHYRPLQYVRAEVERIARQLAELGTVPATEWARASEADE